MRMSLSLLASLLLAFSIITEAKHCGSGQFCFQLKKGDHSFGSHSVSEPMITLTGEANVIGGHRWTYDLHHLEFDEHAAFIATLTFTDDRNRTLTIVLQRVKANSECHVRVFLTEQAEVQNLTAEATLEEASWNVTVDTTDNVADAIQLDKQKLRVQGILEWWEHGQKFEAASPKSSPFRILSELENGTAAATTTHWDPVLFYVLAALVALVLLMLLCIALLCYKNRVTEQEISLLPDKTTPDLMTVRSDGLKDKSGLKSAVKSSAKRT